MPKQTTFLFRCGAASVVACFKLWTVRLCVVCQAKSYKLGGQWFKSRVLCRRHLQSDSLPAVEERLRKLGVPFIKTQVVEGGIRVTQVQLPSPCPVKVKNALRCLYWPKHTCLVH